MDNFSDNSDENVGDGNSVDTGDGGNGGEEAAFTMPGGETEIGGLEGDEDFVIPGEKTTPSGLEGEAAFVIPGEKTAPKGLEGDDAFVISDEKKGVQEEVNNSGEKIDSDETLKAYLEKESEYSEEINKYISSPEELQKYKEAGLVEREVCGRHCLIRSDLDLDYVNIETGKTNAQLIAEGKSPFDPKTGERIELHHIGQKFDSPFAELAVKSEHQENYSILHRSEEESWRRDREKRNEYQRQKRAHWTERAKG